MSKLILLSGPSCVGKSPLYHTVYRFFPKVYESLEKVVLFNDRAPRPGERDGVDYHFRPHPEIEALRNREGFWVIPVRNDLQALELGEIRRILEGGKNAFFDSAPSIVSNLIERGITQQIPATTIFVSPLGQEEIRFLRDPARRIDLPAFIADIMRKKLLRRKQKQMGIISAPDLEDIEIRCRAAYEEMRQAHRFDYIIPNHDGEDSEHWSVFPVPIGDALQSALDFVSILENNPRPRIEHWEDDLVP